MRRLDQQTVRCINVPSPPAGEGSAAERPRLDWVRGSLATIAFLRQPLTRPGSARAPSPGRGEGKYYAEGRRPRPRFPYRGGRGMRRLDQQTVRCINVPSPPAGEGSAAERPRLDWVRGSLATIAFLRQPLTRPGSARAPSPARGEGKYYAEGRRPRPRFPYRG